MLLCDRTWNTPPMSEGMLSSDETFFKFAVSMIYYDRPIFYVCVVFYTDGK